MLLQFDLKHIHKVNFYPSDNNFTQALLVLLVTNMISGVLIRKARGRRGQLSIPKQSATLEVARSAHLTLLNGPL